MQKLTSFYEYQVGGRLPVDAPSYVVRACDEELYNALRAGQFCYVLNSRQMGKSSLRVQVARRLQEDGIVCVTVDLSGIGNRNITADQWYADIIMRLVRSLRLSSEINIRSWLAERQDFSPVGRLGELLQLVLTQLIEQPIVIFFDEIDSTLSLPFNTDDFFALIRSCHEHKRLTFALLGVATPLDLIADKTRTPFNIGRAIELNGFNLHEVQALEFGLADKINNSQAVLREILAWTGGQPFLTQKLCQLVASEFGDVTCKDATCKDATCRVSTESPFLAKLMREILAEPEEVADQVCEIVRTHIIDNWAAQDEPPHLRTIRDRLLSNEQRASRLLGLYLHILQNGGVSVDDSPEQIELLLSGLVVKKQGHLQVYNCIYQEVFNQEWVEKQLKKLRPYADLLNRWVISDYQDESNLLRGQALLDAQLWAKGKSLSNLDYRFLAASEELEKREVQSALIASEQANKILLNAEKQAKNTIRRGLLGLSLVSLVAVSLLGLSGLFAWQTNQQKKQVALSEIKALSISSQASFNSQQTFDALLSGLKAGVKLKQIGWQDKNADLQVQVERTIRQSLYWVHEYNRLIGHGDVVTRVKFHPDGNTLASASWDKTVKIWQRDGKLLYTLRGHTDAVWSINYSLDGKLLASSSRDKTVRIWRVEDGKELLALPHKDWVACVGFSPDGKTIAAMEWNGTMRLWNLQGQQLKSFKTHNSPVVAIHFHPKGEMIATASRDGTAKIWSLDGKEIATLRGHHDWVMYVNFSRDGKNLITASRDKTAKLWNFDGVETRYINGVETRYMASLQGHEDTVGSAVFSRDGETIATAGWDRTVRIWNRKGEQLQILHGHQDAVWGVNFRKDGKTLASSGEDGSVRLWNLEGANIAKINPKSEIHSLSKTNLKSKIKTTTAWRENLGEGASASISFSPKGKILGTTGRLNTATLWNLQDEAPNSASLQGHTDALRNLQFSPDGKMVITTSRDKTAKLWNLDGKEILTLRGHQADVRSAVFSPDGQTIASASWDNTAKLWNLDGKELLTLRGHQAGVRSVNFSPDGQIIVTGSEDGTAKIWNRQGKELMTLRGHKAGILAVAISPDNKTIATVSKDRTVKFWNFQGQLLSTLYCHEGEINNLAFHPDGKSFATASEDKVIKLWTRDGDILQTFGGHNAGVKSVSFSPDGRVLASSDSLGNVIFWHLDLNSNPDKLLVQSCNWVRDYLRNSTNAKEDEKRLCDS
ncbi:WD-repeat protein [Calothrix sp. NIES-4071]|nr:WD-repeat protein [Calothrix sp. NIES-4071]BAZ54520.1 WD-repeat protein [Calothrix sp. NIES-4105]